jgi:hypothetical protein
VDLLDRNKQSKPHTTEGHYLGNVQENRKPFKLTRAQQKRGEYSKNSF